MASGLNNLCWKCSQQPGTFFRTWGKAKKFWRQLKDIAQEITHQEIMFKPEMFLLNIIPEIVDKKIKYMLLRIFTATRLIWAQR